jgi:predicted MPP superfamily phosphohydrolase
MFRLGASLVVVLALLFGVPWWTLVAGSQSPTAVFVIGTVVFVAGALAMPPLMVWGHARSHDRAAVAGDTLLGVVWVLFAWSIIGNLASLVLMLAGVGNPLRSRLIAGGVLIVSVVLMIWGLIEARRVPRVRRVDVTMPRLGDGLDGLRIVLLTDTHYGPIDRARWSGKVTAVVNSLDADIVCHTGDIADGTVERRRDQAVHLGAVKARLARAYVTGNHEYFGDAIGWLDYMRQLGWEPLHNRHIMVERDGSRLVLAGVDDFTAVGSNTGHRADHATALAGAGPDLPVVLLAHQPKQISDAVQHGIDLQLSGHTHGGQIWPFHLLVRTDQPVLQGLTRHGERTQLYTSRGTGFWGPPLRIFAPSEITLLTLRRP